MVTDITVEKAELLETFEEVSRIWIAGIYFRFQNFLRMMFLNGDSDKKIQEYVRRSPYPVRTCN
jgi:hypothetical protein